MSGYSSLSYFIPEILLFATAIGLLLIISYKKISTGIEFSVISIGLISAMLALACTPHSESHGIFSNLLVWDSYGQLIKIFLTIIAGAVLIIYRQNRKSPSIPSNDYGVPFLILVFGAFIIVSANHLIALFVALQLIHIAGFLIAQIANDDHISSIAAWQDFIFMLITSLIMLMGVTLIYSATGTFKISEIGRILSALTRLDFPLIFAIAMILFGFTYSVTGIFRLQWTLKIYRTIPASNRLVLLTIPQFAEIAALIRLFNFNPGQISEAQPVSLALGIFAVATLTFPILWLMKKHDPVDIFNITATAQIGFGLLALGTLCPTGNVAALFHQLVIIISLIAFTAGELIPESNKKYTRLIQIIFLASLIGIPITAGFPAKYLVFSSLVKQAPWFYFLLAIGIGSAALMLIGYGRLVRQNISAQPHPLRSPGHGAKTITILRVVLLLALIWGGIYWTHLTNYIQSILTFYIP